MKRREIDRWAPDDALGKVIGKIPDPDPEPGPDLVGKIMTPLKPIHPGLGSRLMGYLESR